MDNSRFKFRAWDNRSMHYGGFSIHATGSTETSAFVGSHSSELVVMQWTGLKDKNDVDVYEKDIILLNNGIKLVVEYGNCSATADDNYCCADAIGFYLHDTIGECRDEILGNPHPWSNNATDSENIEVFGNIYANPELIKEK